MLTPKARGPLSEVLFEAMRTDATDSLPVVRAESDDDAAIALWALYELHYRGFEDVDESLEWDPALLAVRAGLEGDLESTLRSRFTPPTDGATEGSGDIGDDLFTYVADHDGPSLASFVRREASRDETLELLRHRSIYHLKESDSTLWVLPRLGRAAQTALMELEFDEYGHGDPTLHHSRLFAEGLEAIGLRSEDGAYIDDVPHEILQQNNAMSLFGLHRRLRGAALGHLAAFEMTSSIPSRMISQGLQRLGFEGPMTAYYDEHVEADAVHEQLAGRTICGALVAEDPQLRDDVFLGAFTCLDLEDRYATTMLGRWQQ